MSPRPRTVSDDAILAATARVIGRMGPADFTLGDVAKEVRLSPSTLLQRFGTKRGLLLAVAAGSAAAVTGTFSQARARQQRPLSTLEDALQQYLRSFGRPEELANHVAFLQLDLGDADFNRHLRAQAAAMRWEIERILVEAVRAGDVVLADVRLMARAIQAALNGVLMTWAVDREGAVAARLREVLGALLDPARRLAGRR